MFEKLTKIAEEYEFKIAMYYEVILELLFFLHVRRMSDVRKLVENYDWLFKSGSDLASNFFLGGKAELQTILKDYDLAEKSLKQVEEINRKQSVRYDPKQSER